MHISNGRTASNIACAYILPPSKPDQWVAHTESPCRARRRPDASSYRNVPVPWNMIRFLPTGRLGIAWVSAVKNNRFLRAMHHAVTHLQPKPDNWNGDEGHGRGVLLPFAKPAHLRPWVERTWKLIVSTCGQRAHGRNVLPKEEDVSRLARGPVAAKSALPQSSVIFLHACKESRRNVPAVCRNSGQYARVGFQPGQTSSLRVRYRSYESVNLRCVSPHTYTMRPAASSSLWPDDCDGCSLTEYTSELHAKRLQGASGSLRKGTLRPRSSHVQRTNAYVTVASSSTRLCYQATGLSHTCTWSTCR